MKSYAIFQRMACEVPGGATQPECFNLSSPQKFDKEYLIVTGEGYKNYTYDEMHVFLLQKPVTSSEDWTFAIHPL